MRSRQAKKVAMGEMLVHVRRLAGQLLACLITIVSMASAAHAISMDKTSSMKDYCQAFLGADSVQMWGYLPDAPSHQYCDQIPAKGQVILTFDLLTSGLREMPIEARIIHAPLKPVDDDTDLAPLTVVHRDAKLYPGGVVTLDHNFEESGLYIAVITAIDPATGERKTARFSFTVGDTLYTYLPVILGAVFLAGLVGVYSRHGAPKLGGTIGAA